MSSAASNNRYIVSKRPVGLPDATTFTMESLEIPKAAEGQVVVKAKYISVDPYLRGRLNNYTLGQPMVSGLVGEVTESKNDKFKVGDYLQFYGEWARYQVLDPANPDARAIKINSDVGLSEYLGVLGMPGATAYFGLKDAAQFKAGDMVLVSGAAGAVGSLVGQLAKLWGAKMVIGTAGGAEKCKLVTEKFGFDACIDYKLFNTQEKVRAELKRLAPDGLDLYFDNTGGHVSDAFYDNVRKFGRVAICGQISTYNATEWPTIPNPFMKCIYTGVNIRGFVVFDYVARWGEFVQQVHPLVKEGKIKFEETVREGFEKLPEALNGLFTGANIGKMVVKV